MLHRSETVQLIVAGEDVLPPGLVVEVPLDRLAKAAFEVFLWFPAEFTLDLAGVDRVAEVVAGAVGDEGDELRVASCEWRGWSLVVVPPHPSPLPRARGRGDMIFLPA